MSGQHHLHVRSRMYKKLEEFPSSDAFKRALDRVMYVVAIAGPAAMLPQLYQIFETKDVSSLSMTMWVIWTCTTLIWLVYGLVHREMPIVIAQCAYLALHVTIIVAIFVFS